MKYKIIQGDCLEKLKELEENSVDSIVTDPPYELGFMGKSWDNTGIANNVELWKECLRVLKPGGHLLAFSGSRTHHRMMVAVEDSGFEIRDTIVWAYGQGFPKSLNVAKQIQKKLSLKSDDICSCGQKQKNTNQDFQADCQDHSHSCDEQPLAVQDNDQSLSPLQADVHEHSHVGHNEDVPFEQSNDNDHFQKDKHPLSSDDSFHEDQHLSKDCQVSDNVQYDKPLNKLNERLTVEHKTDSDKLDKLHLGDDLVSSYKDKLSIIDTVYQNLPQCQACKKIILPEGIGTALKPALEFICMARKPLSEKSVAENCLKWGTGGINIDESRVENTGKSTLRPLGKSAYQKGGGIVNGGVAGTHEVESEFGGGHEGGRFPANLIHDNSEEVRECFPENKPGKRVINRTLGARPFNNNGEDTGYETVASFNDPGGNASRFFKSIAYYPKASKSERNMGCEELEEKEGGSLDGGADTRNGKVKTNQPMRKNHHPTVKPIALMEYLIKMITPPKGTVLDPFMGSGSTGIAAKKNGFSFIGIEREEEYCKIAEARITSFPTPLL